jgi:hypothetical protein
MRERGGGRLKRNNQKEKQKSKKNINVTFMTV